jgi:hypothetical protein
MPWRCVEERVIASCLLNLAPDRGKWSACNEYSNRKSVQDLVLANYIFEQIIPLVIKSRLTREQREFSQNGLSKAIHNSGLTITNLIEHERGQ